MTVVVEGALTVMAVAVSPELDVWDESPLYEPVMNEDPAVVDENVALHVAMPRVGPGTSVHGLPVKTPPVRPELSVTS